jgi:lipid-binding SYLF domain-containing protein
MATDEPSTTELRSRIERERNALASSVDSLRSEISEATNVSAKLRAKLPAAAGGALAAGFLIGGGIGATVRLVFRRGREGETKATYGRFRLVDRG